MKHVFLIRRRLLAALVFLLLGQSLALAGVLAAFGAFRAVPAPYAALLCAAALPCFAAALFPIYAAAGRVRNLSRTIRDASSAGEVFRQRTGLREVDELLAELEKKCEAPGEGAETAARILGTPLLPIGGFEVFTQPFRVVLTGYVRTLLRLEAGETVSQARWEQLYAALTAQPVRGDEGTYCYQDDGSDAPRWLRISQAGTQTGHLGVVMDVSRELTEQRRLEHELDYDTLTHLYARTAFKREVHRWIEREAGKVGAMLFADLDNLKYINDTFGHAMGDRLIIRAGELFRGFARHGGIISRISGDEFAVFLYGFDSKEELRALLKGELEAAEQYVLEAPDKSNHQIRFSSGVAWYPEDSDNVTDLLKLSDYAMYEAKHNQKGRLLEFSRESYQANAHLLNQREAISRLLDGGLIRFAFQPIVDLKSGEVAAYEALMRPLLEIFHSPQEILRVAAEHSKLGQLERTVLLAAHQHMEERPEEFGTADLYINSISSQTLSEEDCLFLKRRYRRLFSRIVIEVREQEDAAAPVMERKLASLREFGMRIALDDFGKEHSDEARILFIKPDVVKADIALISGIDADPAKQTRMKELLAFCRSKNIRLVAEGVERREELEELMRLGVEYAQGYYIGCPADLPGKTSEKARQEILLLRETLG